MSHVTHKNESCHTQTQHTCALSMSAGMLLAMYMCDMTRSCVCDMTHWCVWHDSLICVTWLIHVCDMTHSYVWHDSFMCVTWLTHMCDMIHSCVWHGSLICVTWLIHVCDMAHSYVCSFDLCKQRYHSHTKKVHDTCMNACIAYCVHVLRIAWHTTLTCVIFFLSIFWFFFCIIFLIFGACTFSRHCFCRFIFFYSCAVGGPNQGGRLVLSVRLNLTSTPWCKLIPRYTQIHTDTHTHAVHNSHLVIIQQVYRTRAHIHIHIHKHTHVHPHIHTHTHAYTHSHTHTNTHTNAMLQTKKRLRGLFCAE